VPDIVLATLNAKYIHTAFGLRCLLANLGGLRPRAALVEFDLQSRTVDIVERLLAMEPKIIGLGVYVWNVAQTTEVAALLKRLRPQITLILGGPEVSYEAASQPIVQTADYVIEGEADLKFAEVCGGILAGQPPAGKIITAPFPDLAALVPPYDLYTDEDIAHRLIYVEASRGCPFRCEFCLSALEVPVRQAPLPALFRHMEKLLDRGARQLKFVDRTFNLHLPTARAVLEFLLERHRPGQFFHFEVVPDHLPAALRELLGRFPPGAVQLEAGVQTFNPEVAARIERRQNMAETIENLRFLREQTGVHIHSDLIVGLPGESLESFAAGFDRLVALRPQEIQAGILKRLRGAPIARHDREWGMLYNPQPPYEILQNKLIDFATMQRLRRLARYWDLVANSGNFLETTLLLWTPVGQASCLPPSPFRSFLRLSDWLFGRTGRTDGIALVRLAELMFAYLTTELAFAPATVAPVILRDWQRSGRAEVPVFLREYLVEKLFASARVPPRLPKRQSRHWSGTGAGGPPALKGY
jgi:radical SAM superfamily enzyme YgiQ (UPF0313 family)